MKKYLVIVLALTIVFVPFLANAQSSGINCTTNAARCTALINQLIGFFTTFQRQMGECQQPGAVYNYLTGARCPAGSSATPTTYSITVGAKNINTGAWIAGATVRVTGNGLDRTLTTASNGQSNTEVPAGSYTLTVSATGFQTLTQSITITSQGYNWQPSLTPTTTPPPAPPTPLPISPPITIPNPTGWNHSLGEQNVGVILYYVKEREVAPNKTSQEVYGEILDDQNPYSLNSFIKEVSYGKMSLKGVVTPWLPMSSLYRQADVQELITAADPYVDYSKTKRLIFINPRTDIPYGGIGGGELQTYQTNEGPQSFVVVILSFNPQKGNPDFSRKPQMTYISDNATGYNLLAHEFGHSLRPPTVAHPGFLYTGCDGQPYKLAGSALDQSCKIDLDITDQIGVGYGHYNSVIKEKLGWFLPGQVVEIKNSGTYTLNSFADREGIKVLKVPRVTCPVTGNINDPCGGDGAGWYYLEYRTNKGQDHALFYPFSFSPANPLGEPRKYQGIEIRIDGFLGQIINPSLVGPVDVRSSLLLDLDNDFLSDTLKKGQSFVDPHKGTVISVVDVQPDFVTVRVELGS